MTDRAARANRRNAVVALTCAGVFVGMVGVAFASVPLYRLFCQATGFGGTTQVADGGVPRTASTRDITVRFDANVADGLDWSFKPEQTAMTLKLGEVGTARFHVQNRTDKPLAAVAAFNVTPESMGAYFSKIQCFCFNAETLGPGQSADLDVTFFVDPAMTTDKNSAGVHTVTLSYTYFPTALPDRPAAASLPPASEDNRG